MREISLCKSCLKDRDFKPKKFRKKLVRLLSPEDEVELSSCLKVCPRKGVTFAVKEFVNGEKVKSLRAFVRPEESADDTLAKIFKAVTA